MTTRISTHPATVPTVRVDRHTVLVGGVTVGYCDLIDADRFSAAIRGALADAYTAGARDLARSIARHMDTIADSDGSLSGGDCVEALYEILSRHGATTTCPDCCCDHEADRSCPYCDEDDA